MRAAKHAPRGPFHVLERRYGLLHLARIKEAKALMRKVMPTARRVLGIAHNITLRMSWSYAEALYRDDGATLNDLREAVTTLEDAVRTAQRVFGRSHPLTADIERGLRDARERSAPPPS